MKKVNTKNKLKGFFGLFASFALGIGVGVSLTPREVVKTDAADTTYTHTFAAATYDANNQTKKLSNVDWLVVNNGGYYGYDATKGQQIGSSGNPAKSLVLSTTGFPGTIKTVKVSTSGASSVSANVLVKVGSASYGTAKTITASNAEYSFTGTSNGKLEIIWTQTSSKALYVKKIAVTYETTPAIAVGSVAVSPDEASIFVGGTTQLSAKVSPDGAPEGVTWSSSDDSVATVSPTGLVTGLKADTVTITATSTSDNTKKGEAEITVMPVVVEGVSLNKTSVQLYEGKTELLTATVSPANATNQSVTWDSSNTNAVTVNNGLLTAIGAGNSTITVTTEDGSKTATAAVTVLANPITNLIVDLSNVKTTYSLGEDFDEFAGLVVKEKRVSGEETIIEDYDISSVDTMELGKQIVRVEKGDLSEEFVVTVTNEGAVVGSVNIPGTTYIEKFTNSNLSSGYGTSSFTGAGGVKFYYIASRDAGLGTVDEYAIDGQGIMLRRGQDGSSIYFTLEDGLSELSFKYRKAFTGKADRILEILINNTVIAETPLFGTSSSAEETIYEFKEENLNYSGDTDVKIRIKGTGANSQITIDDISWTTQGVFVDGMPYETQAKAFARFVSRAKPAETEGRLLPKSLGPATQVAPSWEEIEEEKGAMDPESLEVFETSTDPEIAGGREVYQELFEENSNAYADASVFNDYIMSLTDKGDETTEDCLANFNLAKEEWNKLSEAAREVFLDLSNTNFDEGRSRLLHWTFVNGWELNGVELQEQALGSRSILNKESVNFNVIATVIIGVIGLTTLAGYYFLKKKKEA